MRGSFLRIGLAAARNAPTVAMRLAIAEQLIAEGARRSVAIVCFPEAYLPGLRGMDFPVPAPDQARQQAALDAISAMARNHGVAVIMGMEWEGPEGMLNVAWVVRRDGTTAGMQAKNQIAPSEDPYYVAEGTRRMFEIDGVPFGIAICHEGWRYPETVRWSARRGAKVVFHPHMTGSDISGTVPKRWCDPVGAYYEKAMIGRAVENEIYFASANAAMRFPESATCVVAPDGSCQAMVPYGEEALLVTDLDLDRATGIYAKRYSPAVYPEDELHSG
jgi:predicted amidohydrolase